MSNEPSGAIDNEFEDFEQDPRTVLEENLSAFAAEVKPGDVVIDMVENRPLFVRRVKADTAVDFFKDEGFDLTTYKAHPWLPVTPDDTVFETVFLPTQLKDIPTTEGENTYDYPRGRLARVPVEFLWDSRTRWFENQMASFVAAVVANVEGHDVDVDTEAVFEAIQAAVGEDIASDGLRRAGIDFTDGEENGDVGDFVADGGVDEDTLREATEDFFDEDAVDNVGFSPSNERGVVVVGVEEEDADFGADDTFDVDEFGDHLTDYGFEYTGFVPAPGMTQVNVTSTDGGDE